MDTKQDKEKIARINELLADLQFQNTACANEKNGTYYDYDGVIALLEQTVDCQKGTARNPRPANLPENIPWSETFADPDDEADRDRPVVDSSTPKEGYNLSAAMREAEQQNATVDLDGSPTAPYDELPDDDLLAGKTLKIRYFDLHGVYILQTVPFSVKELELQAAWATCRVDGRPHNEYAGWTAFQWNEQKRQWWPYRDSKNNERQYDTGRRGRSSTKQTSHAPSAKHHRRKNLERG